ESLSVGMPEHESRRRLGIRRYIERFRVAHTREGTCRHIPDRVAARFAGRDSNRSKTPHQIRRIVDVNEVELKILPGGDVQNTIGILFSELCQDIQLIWGHTTKGNFNALHSGRVPKRIRAFGHIAQEVELLRANPVVTMTVVITLPVTSAPEPRFSENFFV